MKLDDQRDMPIVRIIQPMDPVHWEIVLQLSQNKSKAAVGNPYHYCNILTCIVIVLVVDGSKLLHEDFCLPRVIEVVMAVEVIIIVDLDINSVVQTKKESFVGIAHPIELVNVVP